MFAARLAEEQSANAGTLGQYDELLAASRGPVEKHISAIHTRLREAQGTLAQTRERLAQIHTNHAGELTKLTALNQALSEQARMRASLEQQVVRLEALEQQRAEQAAELKTLLDRRKSLKTDHILMRDRISTMRDEVASKLQHEAGERVRIRVMRNADHLAYQEMLVEGLKGARVRNQNEIIATLMQLRPEQLAQLIQSNLDSFQELTHFGSERSRKILDSFREAAGVEYWGHCRPAREVGGDYYDFLELPGGRFGIAIGDVSGKGVGAALMMASLEASLRALASVIDDPAELIERVSNLVFQASSANRYATLFYARYDPASRCLSYVNAGHNPPVVLRSCGGSLQVFRLETGGPVIGLLRHSYEPGVFSLEAGDLMVLFTDGVSESMNARFEEWGEENLIELAKTCYGSAVSEALRRILSAAQAFAAGAPQHDDMTLVVLRVS